MRDSDDEQAPVGYQDARQSRATQRVTVAAGGGGSLDSVAGERSMNKRCHAEVGYITRTQSHARTHASRLPSAAPPSPSAALASPLPARMAAVLTARPHLLFFWLVRALRVNLRKWT